MSKIMELAEYYATLREDGVRRELEDEARAALQAEVEMLEAQQDLVMRGVELARLDLIAERDALRKKLAAVEKEDQLQGAVDWLLKADGEYFCVATVQRTLRIGYNRAKRLADTAKDKAIQEATK